MSRSTFDLRQTRTVCPYCGVGCGVVAGTRGGTLESVEGDRSHPVNRGRTCAKPLALPDAVHAPDRALVPLRRPDRDGRWREQGWDEAIGWLAGRLGEIRDHHGPEAIAFYISGQLLTEDYYAANKLAKGWIGTNTVDSNSRLCMSSAVAGYRESLGADGPPPIYDDIAEARCFLLLGTNTAACHPIVWARIRDSQAEGATVIVADPRRTDTARAANLHLPVLPGTDLALLNAMLYVIEREGLIDRTFTGALTEGLEAALRVASKWPPARAAQVCGVPAAQIAEAARRFASAPASMALWSMGANQSRVGTLKNQALINLCLATGQFGRPGAGPLSLTGQPNAMGGREVGGLADLLPGYRTAQSATDREEMRRLWELPDDAGGISATPGLAAVDLFEALEAGTVKAIWICATNPAVSMPRSERIRRALARAELVVVSDAYHPTETSALADLVLPAAQWPEKQGTMTNSERRVSLVRRALDPPGGALPDWEIFARIGRAMGWPEGFAWEGAGDAHAEYVATTRGRPCDQSAISHERLEREGSLRWPCSIDAPGSGGRLYERGGFHTRSGRARIVPTPHAPPAERSDDQFPLVLTTGRVASQWHTMTRTGRSAELLSSEPEPFIEVHPRDAALARIDDGRAVRVVSARGAVTLKARITETVPAGIVFAPFHWGELHAPPRAGGVNTTTSGATDPVSKQPELKACAVRLERAERRSADRAPSARRLVIAGGGMAAQATLEAVLEHGDHSAWEISIFCEEAALPYNRIRLSTALADGGRGAEPLRTRDWYERHGVRVVEGTAVGRLDPETRVAVTADGTETGYDAFVIATGSRPALPPIPGLERDGVFTFRTRDDAERIAARARRGTRGVVVGGGLLGLEAARGLIQLGLEVTVIQMTDRVMDTQLDLAAARLVSRRMREVGAEVRTQALTSEVVGNGVVEGVRLSSGEELEAELVVVATGIRPETALAEDSGIEVGHGILVDDELRTSAPLVWAVGECAEHRAQVYGLWGPLREQAAVAGRVIAGGVGAFHGAVPSTTLKVSGIDLLCLGQPGAACDEDDELIFADTRGDSYRKLVIRDGRLVGATLVGDLDLAPHLTELARRHGRVDEAILEALRGNAAPREIAIGDDDALVCSCNSVRRSEILDAIRGGGLLTVEQVSEATRAASGCGGCTTAVAKLISAVEEERTRDLRRTSHPRTP